MQERHSFRIITGCLGVFLLLSGANSFQPAYRMSSRQRQGPAACGRPDRKQDTRNILSATTESSSLPSTDASVSSTQSEKNKRLAMPWSEAQRSALHNKLPKYTVQIPLQAVDPESKDEVSQVFGLWRTMMKEVPEISGYPIDFLQEMHGEEMKKNETLLEVTPGLLPYLDEYEFASAGGVSGKVYGVAGIADGTRIETSVVSNIEVTLPQGFVRTTDGSAAYEVGRPKREDFASDSASVTSSLAKGGGELLKNVQNTGGSLQSMTVEDGDGMLMRLGASTAILLGGATAVSMLSHHLTVNGDQKRMSTTTSDHLFCTRSRSETMAVLNPENIMSSSSQAFGFLWRTGMNGVPETGYSIGLILEMGFKKTHSLARIPDGANTKHLLLAIL
eukprot:scaffold22642_cov134-Cylindrotheca_fusiformis.AAC.6